MAAGPPFGKLEYLYTGSSDVAKDLAFYCDVLGAAKVWDFEEFDTRVAAVRLWDGPMLILAGHREAPNVLPIFTVDDLDRTARELKKRGWRPEGRKFEVPDGPCYLFKDPSGNEYAMLQPDRPHALEAEDDEEPGA